MVKLIPAETIELARKMLNYADHFGHGESTSGMPALCPQCGYVEMHVFWNVFSEQKASLWVWCSHCGASEHATSRVPDRWRNIETPEIAKNLIDTNFEIYKEEIDSHANSLLRKSNLDS